MNYYTAWDIGGAHLKCAILDEQGQLVHVLQRATPLWKGIDILEECLQEIIKEYHLIDSQHAITTTAELVDGFPDRETGINELLKLLSRVLGDNLRFYSNTGKLIELNSVDKYLDEIASANWHASANYLASLSLSGLLVDIGSTTTDIIPFAEGEILNASCTDQERLRTGELLYTGVVRTPVMAICNQAVYKGKKQFLMAEHFATMADVYRIIGYLNEEDDLYPTCDGAEKTKAASAMRLGRMLGMDTKLDDAIIEFANEISTIQLNMIQKTINNIVNREQSLQNPYIFGAGSGAFLTKQIASNLNYEYQNFVEVSVTDDSLSQTANRAAPVLALAKLAFSS